MLLKLRSRAATSQKCQVTLQGQATRPFRRAPAQPRPPAGTTHWVDIMGGSEARGWRSGVQSPPSDVRKGRGTHQISGSCGLNSQANGGNSQGSTRHIGTCTCALSAAHLCHAQERSSASKHLVSSARHDLSTAERRLDIYHAGVRPNSAFPHLLVSFPAPLHAAARARAGRAPARSGAAGWNGPPSPCERLRSTARCGACHLHAAEVGGGAGASRGVRS